MDLRTGFGLALRQVRTQKELTQEDFSNVSSRTYLSTLERGLKSPTIDKVDALADVLDVHPLTLLALAYSRTQGIKLTQLLANVLIEAEPFDG
ncbi:transcriptional regulator with XRE-family HTH domain [Paralcaligenes ureilyticus]|uniref:Transcriptional regulator with XRE-family HTH domain n=2 Tax=Paralcaligenes ureilyticus TaxID=627131 RepID=A0A4R3M988_9BURK|nr:helix-turn-helix transcriptional regulator [Paralcaligenes ureilyticus]TCT09682.1 transcriptional regulator with XRE-family HTH domain [Paralcaligenes ureilyticus]